MINQNKSSIWTYMSEKAQSADTHWMTIFTPVYQREATMERLYRTLVALRLPGQDVALNDGKTIPIRKILKV